jgi:hypothetical protein
MCRNQKMYITVPSMSAGRSTKLWFIVIVILVFQLYSCHPTFYIKITDISDPSHPCFSVSQSKFLLWSKGMWNTLDISEVDKKGNRIRPVWIIEPVENVNIKNLCYGKIPDGYKEVIKAIPLELNKFYLFYPMGMGSYFRITRKKSEIKAEVYTRTEFYNKFVYPSSN